MMTFVHEKPANNVLNDTCRINSG